MPHPLHDGHCSGRGILTVADGVDWNAHLVEKTDSPIHNPRLVEELMVAGSRP